MSNIAVIVEGTKSEMNIWKMIARIFFPDDKLKMIPLPAANNIYQIYSTMKDDDFETDIIEVVREISKKADEQQEAAKKLEGLVRDSFSEVYLFFDFEPQQDNLRKGEKNIDPIQALREMLDAFDNETENGKLYISYPMVEAIRDIRSERDAQKRVIISQCAAFWKCAISLSDLKKPHGEKKKNPYKTATGNNPMDDMRKYTPNVWESLNAAFLHRCACLFRCPDGQVPPETERLYRWYRNNVNPEEIFRVETALLQDFQRIFVLSAFPEFLLDYFKPSYWKQFPDISHGQCAGLNAVLTAEPDNT